MFFLVRALSLYHRQKCRGQVLSRSTTFRYTPCLLLIITLRFTYGERKLWRNIKMSQNIMAMIVAFCINIRAFNRINSKQLNIWNFILLLTEDDSALKVAWKITFRWLVAYKRVGYIKKVYIKSYNDTGDSFLMSRSNVEILKNLCQREKMPRFN